jgi:hypothetical protein
MSHSIKFVNSVQTSESGDFEDAIIEIEHMDNAFYINTGEVSIRIPIRKFMLLLNKCLEDDETGDE